MATHAIAPHKGKTEPEEMTAAEKKAAFLEETMDFVRERLAEMTPAQRIEATARLRASNRAAGQ